MNRTTSDGSRLKLLVPSCLVIPEKKKPEPPPVPGTVRPEDIREPEDPPIHFLKPWKSHEKVERNEEYANRLPCEVDPDALNEYLDRHDVEGTIRAVFKDVTEKETQNCIQSAPAPANPQLTNAANEAMVQDVLKSLEAPFCGSDQSSIVWTFVRCIRPNPSMSDRLGGKKLKNRHKILRGPPWSIMSFADPKEVRRNVIYNGEGNAIAQVDFGHGTFAGIHAHALVLGNLEHTPGSSEDHAFPLETVPWPWLCIPDLRDDAHPVAGTAAKDEATGDDDDDDANPNRGLYLQNTPDTIDDIHWVAVDVPFEDYFGERAFSDEW